jgi:hypothetical protein
MPKFFDALIPRSESRSVYIFTMTCYVIAIDLLGGRIASALGLWSVRASPAALGNARHMVARPLWEQAGMDLVISPIVESLVMIAIIEMARRLKLGALTGVIGATLLFGALHCATIPIWGLIVVPAFFIEGVSYNYWRRVSFWAGLQTIVLIHAFSNLAPFLYEFERRH